MNLLIRLKTFLWVGFCISGCLFLRCTDNINQLGAELQNPDDKISVFNDSLTEIHAYTYQKPNSIALNPTSLLWGYANMKNIGSFQNNFMLEFYPRTTADFGEAPVADSMFLYFNIANIYGSYTDEQTLSLYTLRRETPLYSSTDSIHGKDMIQSVINEYYYYNANAVVKYTFVPEKDSTYKVSLPLHFASRLLDTSYYNSIEEFQQNLSRGFYFVAEAISGNGSINEIKYDSTKMVLHLHNASDTLEYKYIPGKNACNIFFREYNTDIKYLNDSVEPSADFEQELFYVKNNNAFEARIDIKGFSHWGDSINLLINKVQLKIHVVPDSVFSPNLKIYAYRLDSNTNMSLEDYNLRPPYYEPILFKDSYYLIRLNYAINNAIERGEDEMSIILTSDDNYNQSRPNGVALKGPTNTENPAKLQITYTKINY